MKKMKCFFFQKAIIPVYCFPLFLTQNGYSKAGFETDTIHTTGGTLEMVFIGHGTLLFKFNNLVIHIDPVSGEANYSVLPKADIILVTHQHGDHFDISAIHKILKENTKVILTEKCFENAEDLINTIILKNGENTDIYGISIEAVPAYNIKHMRSAGNPFHPKGEGNGYILTFGDKKVYIAGDTENTPEMKTLQDIDIAFLPMNLPYTMAPEMVADAAKAFRPKILYPYHFGNTKVEKLAELLKDEEGIEVRIRNLK